MPQVIEATAVRYNNIINGCGDGMECPDHGTLRVLVSATDDATPKDQMGFVVELVSGHLPDGITPDQLSAASAYHSSDLSFLYDIDGPPFVVVLQIRAIDLNGNLGPPTTVTICDNSDGGCSTVAQSRSLVTFAVLVIAIALRLRRRAGVGSS